LPDTKATSSTSTVCFSLADVAGSTTLSTSSAPKSLVAVVGP